MTKRLISACLCVLVLVAVSAADEYFENQLDRGIRTSEAYSYSLLEKARTQPAASSSFLHQAERFAPNLPAVFFEMGRVNFRLSPTGILDSVNDVVLGIDAYNRNFWWALTFLADVFCSLLVSFFLASALIVLIRAFNDFPLLRHEIMESPRKALLSAGLIVLAVASPVLLVAGLFVILGLYLRRLDKTVVMVFLLAVICSPFLFRTVTLLVQTFVSGTVKAVVEVNESKGNEYALAVLGERHGPTELFSYALALKRTARYEEAIARYRRLLEARPDPKAYVNLANCYVALNQPEAALALYEKALGIAPLASAYYNASQVYRETLNFEKGEEYFQKALAADRSAVSAYREIYGRNPNRLVVDETLSFQDLWRVFSGEPVRTSLFGLSMVTEWVLSGMGVLLLGAFVFLGRQRSWQATRCKRCGVISCPLCDKSISWGGMCPQCFRSLVKLDELEVKVRVAQLLDIYESQKKRRTTLKVLALVLPGAAQVFSGKVLYGFLLMWPFLFFAVIPIMNQIFGRGGGPAMHGFFQAVACVLAGLIYLLALLITRQRIAKGWL